jgi:XTP/dITP diphosphohydrolase
MKLIVASRNRHKVKELRDLLAAHLGEAPELVTMDEAGFTEEIVEDGVSFAENACIKAETVCAATGCAAVGDDSGLCVTALDGAPGIYSARYAGEHGNDAANNALLLRNLEGKTDRSAYFACAIACAFPDGRETLVVEGRAHGVILEEARGEGGFGYDPLFYVPELGKTFSELSEAEKNAVSHRGVAVKDFARALSALQKGDTVK